MQSWYVIKNIRDIRKTEKRIKIISDFIYKSEDWYGPEYFNTVIRRMLEYYLTSETGKLIIIEQLINNDKQLLEVLSSLFLLRKYL